MYCDVDENKEGQTLVYVYSTASEKGPLIFKTLNAEATISFQHYYQSAGLQPMEKVEYNAFTTQADATAAIDATHGNLYVGAGVDFDLINAEAGCFDLTLGFGLDTGIGIKNWTFNSELAGSGVMIGKYIGVEVFSSSFGINLENLFGGTADLFK